METLIIFARVPRAGDAKTRLAPRLGHDGAHTLYQALFVDTLALAAAATRRKLLSLAGSVAGLALPPGWETVCQPELSFGERLAWSFDTAFAHGGTRVVLIGADAPHLPPAEIEAAFDALHEHDVVIGPTYDGGWYLLGMREPSPWIFADISWSTASVFEQTVAVAVQRSKRVQVLREEFDVDTADEARRLRDLLAQQPERAPHTAAIIADLLGAVCS